MKSLSIFLMLLAGFSLSIQGPVNPRLRLALESPVFAATISSLSGGLVLLCIMTTGTFGGAGTGLRGFQSCSNLGLAGRSSRGRFRFRLNHRWPHFLIRLARWRAGVWRVMWSATANKTQ
jgi:hypothetical protein